MRMAAGGPRHRETRGAVGRPQNGTKWNVGLTFGDVSSDHLRASVAAPLPFWRWYFAPSFDGSFCTNST